MAGRLIPIPSERSAGFIACCLPMAVAAPKIGSHVVAFQLMNDDVDGDDLLGCTSDGRRVLDAPDVPPPLPPDGPGRNWA